MLIGKAAAAFRRVAATPFAEVSMHALVTHDARDQVTAAVRESYIHRLPPIRPQCFARFRNSRADARGGKTVYH